MKVDINIGLDAAGETPSVQNYYKRIETAVKALKQAGYQVDPKAAGVRDSGSEPTMVIRIEGTILLGALKVFLYDLSEKLKQDCIAVKPEGLDGFLVGPRAAAWGKFDPDQFISPDVLPDQPVATNALEYAGLTDTEINAIIKEEAKKLLNELVVTGGEYSTPNQAALFRRVARVVEELTVVKVANILGRDTVVF